MKTENDFIPPELLYSLVEIEGEFVVFYDKDSRIDIYDIPLDRLSTPEHLLAWVSHMLEKSWVTTDIMSDFIDVVCQKQGFKIIDYCHTYQYEIRA